jgi:hypothetical protein
VTAPFAWWWAIPAGGFTLLALLTASTYAVAVPATTAAVALAALAVGHTLARLPSAAPPVPAEPGPVLGVADVRAWLRAGRLGREDLLLLLDRLERRSTRPELPSRAAGEIERLLGLPRREFLRYLTGQLTRLEGAT